MVSIFISYRHRDSSHVSGRIADRLEAHFGPDSVFRDVKRISVGATFDTRIKDALGQSDVTLAIIGDRWHGDGDGRASRLLEEADFLRQELAFAIEHEIPIVPVLVDDTCMPTSDELPDPLKQLSWLQATPLRDRDFEYDMARLISAVEALKDKRRVNIRVPEADEPVTAEHLVLRHTSWRMASRDNDFGHEMYGIAVKPHGDPRVLERIEYIYYLLPPEWPITESPKRVDRDTPGFVMKNLAWADLDVRARVYVARQSEPVLLSAFVRLTMEGPRIDS